MPWESAEDRRRRAAATLTALDPHRPEAAYLEPWAAFAHRWWNLDGIEAAAEEAVACTDGDMGFGGALTAIGIMDEACSVVMPAFAEANEVALREACSASAAEVAASLKQAGVAWSPPPSATRLADLCCRTCAQ